MSGRRLKDPPVAPALDRPTPGVGRSGPPPDATLFDLNLLRVLDVLLEERSVTRAGARLDLTQSAVSHALGRLRHVLSDDLFQRTAQGLQPTPRAMEIAPVLHAALGRLQGALHPTEFDPATSDRRFRVVADASACALLIPALVARLRARAPNMRLHVSESSPDLAQQLDAGKVDFVLGAVAASPERFARERLRREALAWIVRADHPLAQGPPTLEAIMAAPHVAVASPRAATGSSAVTLLSSWEDTGALDADLARLGLRRRVCVMTPDFCSARAIVLSSDMVGLAPCRLALAWGQRDGLRVMQTQPGLWADVSLLYGKDRLAEPPVGWLRGLLMTL
ncbi:LysR family transcriptional regulator [Phenylobacterium sp.]|jgi:DNA-binding transcriptional LysR family regulator|uniref:LysR family transcriptional regulator n=1 Tax=Phenylobacterium sp. TaxID=1871053 RepID=UPI002E37EFD2|nr:LysR family transcriptional regulator [Phenylobacterium sp.]HEX3366652.1 LysR family transcriptional regulator [Phenylobacterium sp.]